MNDNQKPLAFSPEDLARRRRRSVMMGLFLAGLMLLFYVTTIVRVVSPHG